MTIQSIYRKKNTIRMFIAKCFVKRNKKKFYHHSIYRISIKSKILTRPTHLNYLNIEKTIIISIIIYEILYILTKATMLVLVFYSSPYVCMFQNLVNGMFSSKKVRVSVCVLKTKQKRNLDF